uniref:Malate dehydrogenase 1B, NAD (soluble) n=1 Tax=Labrus bergylta TaxID=56723 RepID=A0A3Q3GT77_9LABR
MAKFVLAGKVADCPHYAKAELLADKLRECLPNFRMHKIEWLEDTCKRNGWKHERSPLVWRELVFQGGKGMLLGGFNDFMEHDNRCDADALSPTCRFLIPALLSAEVFLHVSAISLHLLHLEGEEDELEELKVETEDLALPLLHQNEEKKNFTTISGRYREYGQLIDTRANKKVKVIVSGDSFVNLRCSLLLDNAHSVDSGRFVAMATQLENEARAAIAKKLKVRPADVAHVIVWGNISGSFYIDMQRAQVSNYAGAISGPAFFTQPVLKILHDRKWLETDLQESVGCQRAAVASKTCRTAAMTEANGILSVLKPWNGNGGPDEVVSLGVLCKGYFNLPDGIVLSVPVTFKDGEWSVLFDVTVGEVLQERLQLIASELGEVSQDESFCCLQHTVFTGTYRAVLLSQEKERAEENHNC